MARKAPKPVDGPEWLAAYRSAPKGVWLVAGAALDAPVPVDQGYPHIHGREVPGAKLIDDRAPRYGRKECLACAGADAPLKPLQWVLPAAARTDPTETATQWRFGCLLCRAAGQADSEANANGLLNLHLIEACPATAWSEEEFELRQLRRQILVDLYPDDVPAYEHPYRPHQWFEHG